MVVRFLVETRDIRPAFVDMCKYYPNFPSHPFFPCTMVHLHHCLSNFIFSHDSDLMLYRKMHSSRHLVIYSTQSSWFQSPRGYQDPQMCKSYIKGLSILCNCVYHIPLFNQSQMEPTGWNCECRTCLHLVPQKISSVSWDGKPMEAKVVHFFFFLILVCWLYWA